MNDERKIVEVRQCSRSRKLYYQVGTFSLDNTRPLEWTEEKDVASGERGGIAINNVNEVVVVYEHTRLRKLLYKVGILHGNTVNWGEVKPLDSGRDPAVAINDAHTVVVAYQHALLGGIHYRTGRIDKRQKIITWIPEAVPSPRPKLFSSNAEHVTVAMNRDGFLVAAASSGNVIVSFGKVNFDMGGLEWKDQTNTGTSGCTPAISINNENTVILVQRSKAARHLSYREGRLSTEDGNRGIRWACDKIKNYDLGCNPSIALSNHGEFLEEHETNFTALGAVGHKLYYRVGKIQPREQGGEQQDQDEEHEEEEEVGGEPGGIELRQINPVAHHGEER